MLIGREMCKKCYDIVKW